MTVVGLTGYAQTGKDTAASFLVDEGFTRLAFADILRQSVYNLNPIGAVHREACRTGWGRVQYIVDDIGWERAKVEHTEIRELLQRMGTEVGRELYGIDFWVERVLAQIDLDGDYVITDVRFPNEEQAVHLIGGKLFKIVRPGTEAVNGHASEAFVDAMPVDGVINNVGDLDEYRAEVLAAVGL